MVSFFLREGHYSKEGFSGGIAAQGPSPGARPTGEWLSSMHKLSVSSLPARTTYSRSQLMQGAGITRTESNMLAK